MVLGGFSLSTTTQAHDVQLKGDLSPINDAGHTGVATTPSSTQAGPLSAFLGGLLHVSQHDGNRKSKLLKLARAFHSRQVLWLHRGWEVCAARACGWQRPASPPRNLGMRSRPLIRSPCADLAPDVDQCQIGLVIREDIHFCLSGTSLLSCDPTPCRPSRLTYASASARHFERAASFRGGNDGRPAGSRSAA